MGHSVRLFFWIALLLVGVNLAIPDPIELTPLAVGRTAANWAYSDDDDLQHSHGNALPPQNNLPLSLSCCVVVGLALLGQVLACPHSPNPQHPSLCHRIPRSPPAY
jgi:hypothetical protein